MIYSRLWSTALINQLMSLEVTIGLSTILNKKVVLYNMKDQYEPNNMYSPVHYFLGERYREMVSPPTVRRLNDILDWDSSGWQGVDKNLPDDINGFWGISDYQTINLFEESYVNCDPDNTVDEDEFRCYRQPLILDENINYNFINTLHFYCRFFFNRTPEVDSQLNKIKWHQPYIDLANDISKELGEYSSIHLRQTDNGGTIVVDEYQFVEALDILSNMGKPIILATDNPYSSKVTNNSNRFIVIDNIIREGWADRFRQLPHHDEVVLGLITLLILTKSKHFIGTPGSTYTGYVHRILNQNDNPNFNFMNGQVAAQQNPQNLIPTKPVGKYSWSQYPHQPTWWREWPESKLRV